MKKVLYPINVPESEFCWDGQIVCEHYDNEGGHCTCDLKFHIDHKQPNNGKIQKPEACAKLKNG